MQTKKKEIPKTRCIVYSDEDFVYFYQKEYITYTYCLSKKRKDEKMMEKYGNTCIEFPYLVKEEFDRNDGINIELTKVMYGREAIEYIKSKIIEVYQSEVKSIKCEYIKDILSELQFCVKDEKYKDEDEVRIIAYIDPEKFKSVDMQHLSKDNKYLYIERKNICVLE